MGSSVNYVVNSPTIPRVVGDDYAFYLTGTASAREAAQDLIRKLIAAGVVIRFQVEYPEYLFTCSIKKTITDEMNDPDYRGSRTDNGTLIF